MNDDRAGSTGAEPSGAYSSRDLSSAYPLIISRVSTAMAGDAIGIEGKAKAGLRN
jgi:hypothetical protein